MVLPCQQRGLPLPTENLSLGNILPLPCQGRLMKSKKEKIRIGFYFVEIKKRIVLNRVYKFLLKPKLGLR